MRGFRRILAVGVVLAVVGAVTVLAGPALGVIGGGTPAPDETLTYVAVTPCAVFDSRASQGATGVFVGPYLGDKVGGVFVGTNNKTLQVTGTFPAGQGGGNVDCGVPASARAVHINIIAANALTAGNLVVTDAGGTPPSGGVVNYQVVSPSLNNSNAFNVPLSSGGALDVYANCGNGCTLATVQARGVVNGYWVAGVDVYESFDRTIVVGGSGTDLENGTALKNALAAAVAQSPSAGDPWLIKVEPGVFDLGAGDTGLDLAGSVHLAGSGQAATRITCSCTLETVLASSGVTQIDDITITNTATNITADGVAVLAGTLNLTDSTVIAASDDGLHNEGTVTVTNSHIETSGPGVGGQSDGIFNTFGATITVSGSTVFTAGNVGLTNEGTATVTNSHIETSGTVDQAAGLLNDVGATVTITDSTVISAAAEGLSNSGSATVTNSHIETTGTGLFADGIFNSSVATIAVAGSTVFSANNTGVENDGMATITNSYIESIGAVAPAEGILNNPTATLDLFGSVIVAAADTGILNSSGVATVTNTSINSPVDNVDNTGTLTCLAVSYLGVATSFNPSSCP